MTRIKPEEVSRAEFLAKSVGARIPEDISRAMWALPILEAMLSRIVELEQRIEYQEAQRQEGGE